MKINFLSSLGIRPKNPGLLLSIASSLLLFTVAVYVGTSAILFSTADLLHPTRRYPILAKCSGNEGTTFKRPKFSFLSAKRDPIDIWFEKYEEEVEEVVVEYMDPSLNKVDCKAKNSAGLLKPQKKMVTMAKKLPPWKHSQDSDKLTRHDIGAVLLEYLRTYECSLVERNLFLPLDVATEILYETDNSTNLFSSVRSWFTVFSRHAVQRRKIVEQVASSRRSIHRLVSLLGGMERMRLLSAELECVQRASLDARNSFALAAEASSCMPRVWDNKDPLRDLSE